jgi:hypothetical protein
MKYTAHVLKTSVKGNKLLKYIFTENNEPLKIRIRYNSNRKDGSKLHFLPTKGYFKIFYRSASGSLGESDTFYINKR